MAVKTIIEINGRKYDALTGHIVEDSKGQDQDKPAATKSINHGVIDGFQKPKQKLHSSISPHPHNQKKTQKSQTLARQIVKKPSVKHQLKSTDKVEPKKELKELTVAETRRKILSKTSPERLERAKTTHQSTTVTRFSGAVVAPEPKVTEPIAIAREQVTVASHITSAPPITTSNNASDHPTKRQVFTHPLAGANTHLSLPPKKRRLHHKIADTLSVSTRAMSLAAACLAIVVLASFFAYQRVPNISMRVAASRAGFAGTVPGTVPAGYAFSGPIKYEKDVIVVSYKSNSDDRNFKIVQRPSNWSTEALLANYVNGTKMRYQTYNNSGLTVYVLAGNDAAWVNKGIWYTLSGTKTLSTEQVLAMAASM